MSKGTPVARRFGPVKHIRSAVVVSIVPEAAHPADEDLVLVQEALAASICSAAWLIQSPRRLRKSWLRSPLTPPMRR